MTISVSVHSHTVNNQLCLTGLLQAFDRVHPVLMVSVYITTSTNGFPGAITCAPAGPLVSPLIPFTTPTNIIYPFGLEDSLTHTTTYNNFVI
jgi:hypothetical protein